MTGWPTGPDPVLRLKPWISPPSCLLGNSPVPDQDEVVLWWRVWTDGGYSDDDCLSPGHGAAQIDDITVYFDDELITFDDFEAGSPVSWVPVQESGVGDFAHLRNKLGDNDPCRSNTSYQVNFIDDGVVVPGTGGTDCIDHCYDPGHQIVNNTGGLQAEDPQTVFLHNQIYSPPVAWVPGNHGAELSFDVYLDEAFQHPDDAGIFFEWYVRSTASSDPADLENASWEGSGNLFHGGPAYKRDIWPVHHKLVPDPLWVQIALGVNEFGHHWGINGLNGTPAPYVDNVAFKIWDPSGPEILIKSRDLFSDAFPETGSLNPNDLSANWCRVDIQGTVYVDINQYVLGDSLEAEIKPIRKGATVPEPAALHWVMSCNPIFNSVRLTAPDGQGMLRGMVTGGVVLDYQGQPRENIWSFDLPDTGFFFPGDMLHYYLTASDELAGHVRTSVWPPDTTGVLDFTIDSPFPSETTVRALPTITQPEVGPFSHPSLLFCDGTAGTTEPIVWFDALQELGFRPGLDYDIMNVHKGQTGTGLGAQTTVTLLAGYQTLVYTSGCLLHSLSGSDWSNDARLVADWLATGEKQALLVGDHFVDGLHDSGDGSSLMYQLGVGFIGGQIGDLNGGMRDLQVSPVAGGGVLPDDWSWEVFAGCPDLKNFDAINNSVEGQVSATLDPAGSPGGPYAALVTVDDTALANRTAVMPFDLVAVTGMADGPSKDRTVYSARAYLLNFLLYWLGAEGVTPVDDVPGIGQISVTAHPNPFNPQTTIAFELPRAMEVSLDIFDLQGRLVRSLLQSSPHTPGRHDQVWDGRDAEGQATASGVYFYKFTAGEQNRVGKLTLLK